MKTTAPWLLALFLIGVSANAWDGPASDRSTLELEQMTDAQLIKEGLSVCIKADDDETAALEYLRNIAGVVRARHVGYSHPEFSDMLAAAAAENPSLCRRAAKAALEKEEEPK
jgi:hypothetical protein